LLFNVVISFSLFFIGCEIGTDVPTSSPSSSLSPSTISPSSLPTQTRLTSSFAPSRTPSSLLSSLLPSLSPSLSSRGACGKDIDEDGIDDCDDASLSLLPGLKSISKLIWDEKREEIVGKVFIPNVNVLPRAARELLARESEAEGEIRDNDDIVHSNYVEVEVEDEDGFVVEVEEIEKKREKIHICLLPKERGEEERLCLGFFSVKMGKFVCVDGEEEKPGESFLSLSFSDDIHTSHLLCGFTSHLSKFALIRAKKKQSENGNKEAIWSVSDVNRVFFLVGIIVIIFVCCCYGLVIVFLLRKGMESKRLIEEKTVELKRQHSVNMAVRRRKGRGRGSQREK